MVFLLFLLAVVGFALYVSSAEERRRLLQIVCDTAARYPVALSYLRPAHGSFDAALRARTPWLLATPALVAAALALFAARVFGEGAAGDPATLVRWGANLGRLTTTGEWWRLVSAPLLHDGVLTLLVGSAAIAQLGPILERQMGSVTFATVFIAAGVFGGLMDLSAHPETVTTSGTAAVCGLYGLLLASIVRGALRRSDLSIPPASLARLLPIAAALAIALRSGGPFDLADKAGLFTGLVSGLVVSRDLRTHKPTAQRLALVTSATMAIAAAAYVPLHGFTDIRPELASLITLEEKTASAYEAAVKRFRLGRETPRAMAELIARSILPELEAADARISALRRVPPVHQAAVAAALDYLRLRTESWRLRADALGKSDMQLLRKADAAERASLAALAQLKRSPSVVRGV
jgi:membrane associated rhomboid family serine protease